MLRRGTSDKTTRWPSPSTVGAGGVIIEGTAKIEELSEEIRRKLCQRYVHPEDLDKYMEYAKANFQSILLRIHPENIISWDYTKDPFLGSLRQMRSDY